jgi:hypothetical protein
MISSAQPDPRVHFRWSKIHHLARRGWLYLCLQQRRICRIPLGACAIGSGRAEQSWPDLSCQIQTQNQSGIQAFRLAKYIVGQILFVTMF